MSFSRIACGASAQPDPEPGRERLREGCRGRSRGPRRASAVACGAGSSKCSRPYGLSSSTRISLARQISRISGRRAAESVTPAGLWKFGIVYRNLMRRPWPRRCAMVCRSASGMSPSSSIGDVHDARPGTTGTRRARRRSWATRRGSTSPGSMNSFATRSSACCEPVVTTTSSTRSADALERHDLEDLLAQRGDALTGAVLQRRRALRRA